MWSRRGRVIAGQGRNPGVRLVLWWDGAIWRKHGRVHSVASLDIGSVDWGQLHARLVRPGVCLGTPGLPMGLPSHKPVLLVVDTFVKLPVERKKPIQFHRVQVRNWDAANLRPRTVLEGVVVEELAAKDKRDREHTVELAGRSRGLHFSRGKHTDTSGQVVESQEDRGAGQAGGGKDLQDVFAELGEDRRSWVDASKQVNI